MAKVVITLEDIYDDDLGNGVHTHMDFDRIVEIEDGKICSPINPTEAEVAGCMVLNLLKSTFPEKE